MEAKMAELWLITGISEKWPACPVVIGLVINDLHRKIFFWHSWISRSIIQIVGLLNLFVVIYCSRKCRHATAIFVYGKFVRINAHNNA